MKKTGTPPKVRAKKASVKRITKKTAKKVIPRVSTKVDYYPNRMTVAVSALAGTAIVLLALIAVLGSR